jgi:hypothetical protein
MLCCLVFVCVEVESSSPNESAGSPDALPTSRFFFSSSLFSLLFSVLSSHPCSTLSSLFDLANEYGNLSN